MAPDGVDFDDMMKQGLSQVLMRADNELLMTYHLGGGSDADRKAGATWLAPMFGSLDARQLVVCPGAQAAIAALILALTEPGDVLPAEPTTYPGLRAAATQFGRHLVAVEADQHGMIPAMLEQACRQHKPRLAYLNPTLQNPTAIAHRHVCPGTGGLHLDAVEMPDAGLRVAFVLLRDPHERERFLVALRAFALMVAPLTAGGSSTARPTG